MTITEMVAVMLAYENGAKIKTRYKNRADEFLNPHWFSDKCPQWNWSVFEYRVAEFPQEQYDDGR